MRAERKPQLTLNYPGRITNDQGIVKILTASHRIYLSICFWHLSCQKLREHAELTVPRISISRVLCLQISTHLSKGRSIIVSFDRVKIACGSPKVMAESSHANKLLGFSAHVCLLRQIMRCLKVLAGVTASLCWGLPHANSDDVELMQQTQQMLFPYQRSFFFQNFDLLTGLQFSLDFLTTSFISPVES